MSTQYIKKTDTYTGYFKDPAMTILHRRDGPAVQYADGYQAWYLDGELHRRDGPAVSWEDGTKAWYLYDKKYTEREFLEIAHELEFFKITNPHLTVTMDQIAAAFGVPVDKLKITK